MIDRQEERGTRLPIRIDGTTTPLPSAMPSETDAGIYSELPPLVRHTFLYFDVNSSYMAGSNGPSGSADSTGNQGSVTDAEERPASAAHQDAPEEARTELTEDDSVQDNRYAVTHEEAVESDEFLYGKVFSTVGKPSDADEGQIRLDYDDPDTEWVVVIMEDDRVDLRKEVVTRVVFPRGGSKAESSILG